MSAVPFSTGRSAAHVDRSLRQSLAALDEAGIELGFAELKGPVRDRLEKYGLAEPSGDSSVIIGLSGSRVSVNSVSTRSGSRPLSANQRPMRGASLLPRLLRGRSKSVAAALSQSDLAWRRINSSR